MQEVIRGKKSLLQVPAFLQRKNAGHVLFVTGHHLMQDKLFSQLCDFLPVPCHIIHPHEGVLQTEAIPQFEKLDTVIAIGGGKVIDFAKGILYRHANPVFFIAAPTTAGSGSEATPIAVFYRDKEKVSLDAPQLLPGVAILDSELLIQLPPHQRAVSGADAVAQCIESIWSVHSTETSAKFALTGMELLWQHLGAFVNDKDENSTENTLWAAHLAGRAIAITRTTGPHALSYFLTAHYGVPHGQAVALTLPLFFLYNDEEHTKSRLEKIYPVIDVHNANEAFLACRQMMQRIGLATTLKELQLEHISLDDWLQSVNQQRFSNNPAPFDANRLKALFQRYLY